MKTSEEDASLNVTELKYSRLLEKFATLQTENQQQKLQLNTQVALESYKKKLNDVYESDMLELGEESSDDDVVSAISVVSLVAAQSANSLKCESCSHKEPKKIVVTRVAPKRAYSHATLTSIEQKLTEKVKNLEALMIAQSQASQQAQNQAPQQAQSQVQSQWSEATHRSRASLRSASQTTAQASHNHSHHSHHRVRNYEEERLAHENLSARETLHHQDIKISALQTALDQSTYALRKSQKVVEALSVEVSKREKKEYTYNDLLSKYSTLKQLYTQELVLKKETGEGEDLTGVVVEKNKEIRELRDKLQRLKDVVKNKIRESRQMCEESC